MKINFTSEQLAILNQALMELPYRLAAPLIASINQQIQEQQDRAETNPTIEINRNNS